MVLSVGELTAQAWEPEFAFPVPESGKSMSSCSPQYFREQRQEDHGNLLDSQLAVYLKDKGEQS